MLPQYDEPDVVEHDPDAELRALEQRKADYERLCTALKGMRDTAVKGRAESGIEDIWTEDQEHYDGIDDANRPDKASKPSTMTGTVKLGGGSESAAKQNRSTVFVEITRPYVEAASARVADMLLPTDDRNWTIVPTPIPDLVEQLKDETPAQGANGKPVMAQGPDGQQVQAAVKDMAAQVLASAKKACEKAQTRIDDWLTEAMFLDECRTVIDDAARIGTGIIKGPVPKKQRKKAVIKALEGIGIVIEESIVPNSCRVDAWNFYPDPDCGEDIQRGKYVFEKDDITSRQLGDLKGLPGYQDDVIEQILAEGPDGHKEETNRGKIRNRSDSELYQIWYFHGYLSAEDMDLLGESHGDGEQFPVIATIVNDKIIKAALSPLDSGEFPYDVFVWQRRPNHWAGKGVSRQMRVEQRGVNTATRALMDNMGESARPHRVINRNVMYAGPDRWTWYAKEGEDVPDVSKAMTFFDYPSKQLELMNIINFWSKKAEDATGLPMLLQGQLGSAPDTVGGMQMLSNNASSVLRRIAKNYDSRITVRHIGRYYEWLLIHGPDNSEKGDFTVKARGSSALVERDTQAQLLMQLVGLAKDPAYKLSPAKIAAKILKAQRLDMTDIEMDEAEIQQVQQAMQAPQDPRVAVAQMNAQARSQDKQAELQAKAEMEQARRDFEAQQAEMDRALEQYLKEVDAQIATAEMRGDMDMNNNELKVALARDAAKLKTQINLARQVRAPQVATPAMEPVGRAQLGMAFQQ